MSRSNPTLTNPATRFFEWKGGEGKLQFYDKEKQESINVPLPFSFLPLDELSTITGYDKAEKSGFWSNEVRDITKDELIVRSKSGIRSQGTYKNSQGVVQMPRGANYTKSIYIAYRTRDGWQIGNLKASGSALSAWIEFGKNHKPETGKVTMSRGDVQESSVGEFYPPQFKFDASSGEEDAIAVNLDKELQIYLEQYLKQPPITDVESEIVNGTTHDITSTDQLSPPIQPSRSQEAIDKKADRDEDWEISELVQNHREEVMAEQDSIDPNEIPF